MPPNSRLPIWDTLTQHRNTVIEDLHLRDLLQDEDRSKELYACAKFDNPYLKGQTSLPSDIVLDYSHQRITAETKELLLKLADEVGVKQKTDEMFSGKVLNETEGRSVLHVALRAPKDEVISSGGTNVVPEVHEVLDKIKGFSEKIRSGEHVGVTGKPLTSVVAIGIGGSYLGPLFVHNAMSACTSKLSEAGKSPQEAAAGRQLRFLANVDPVDVAYALEGLDAETTLVVIISKTFTTAETMLNARTVRDWLIKNLGEGPETVAKHVIAVSTAHKLVAEFGIDPANTFGFWEWVGGRFSATSAVGVMPLALQYGFEHVEQFLAGAWAMDSHFRSAQPAQNLPVLTALLSVWNVSFLGINSRAILPYAQALAKLPSHIQQLSMESNGKGVGMDGERLEVEAGEIDFGEPGTNGQHSFYQLLHQGRQVAADFIGAVASQNAVDLPGEPVSNHDELMCNFFAQPDALALGKTAQALAAEGCKPDLIPHKTFNGNRPSLSLLLPCVDPFTVGQLLSLYEHRIAVQGWVWGVNSFDQWGVELGKVLAKDIRERVAAARKGDAVNTAGLNSATGSLLSHYIACSKK